MNNININNLFNINKINTINEKNIEKEFNVLNLVKANLYSYNMNDDFIVNKIINLEKDEKKKIKELYELKYKECLLKINYSIDMNLTDIFYNVNENFFGYKNYNSLECLKYVQYRLRKKKFETFIINNTIIFVSWININN